MRFVALEEHFLPKDIVQDVGIDPASVWGLLDALDVDQAILRVTDDAGVDVQVLSVPTFSLARAAEQLDLVTGPATSLADTIHEHLWVTTCGYMTDQPLLCRLGVLGADRIMFSVDYPFSDSTEATRFVRDAPLSPADVEKIAHGNAERLLRV